MKVNNINILAPKANNNGAQNKKTTNFNGLLDSSVNFWSAVDRGGLAASFTVQDIIGTGVPRTVAAKNIGKEYTGKNNWAAVAENALREVLTGPSMFVIPAGVLYGVMKTAGEAHGVPIEAINDLTNIVLENKDELKKVANDPKAFKEVFYTKVMNNTLSNFETAGGQNVLDKAKQYAKDVIQTEEAHSKGFFKKLKGTAVEGSKEDLLDGLMSRFVRDKKQFTTGYNVDFLTGKVAKNSKEAGFDKIIDRMGKYSNDFVKTLGKKNLDTLDADNLADTIYSFSRKRMGGRFLTNIGMGVFAAAAMCLVPKIYSIGKTNPETAYVNQQQGEGKADTAKKADVKVEEKEAKAEKQDKKDVSFSGNISKAVENIGYKVAPKNPDGAFSLSKIASKLESDWINVARPVFYALVSVFTLGPRFAQSIKRDVANAKENGTKNQWDETKNIARRDVTTILTILFAMKGLSSVMASSASKKSGIMLTNKAFDKDSSLFQKFKDALSPDGGVIANSDKFNASRLSNFNNVDEITRLFNDNEKNLGVGSMNKIINLGAKGDEKTKLQTIMEGLLGSDAISNKALEAKTVEKALKAPENKQYADELLNLMNDKNNNPLLKAANRSNALYKNISFVLVAAFLGFGLPKLNEFLIKRKYKGDSKNKAEAADSKKTDNKAKTTENSQVQNLNIVSKANELEKETFKDFL